MKTNQTGSPLGYFLIGAYVAVAGMMIWQRVDGRISRLETRSSTPIGLTEPSPSLDERMAEIRRESARDFAAVLKEEGLVISEVAK
jgi:hypothetical protein